MHIFVRFAILVCDRDYRGKPVGTEVRQEPGPSLHELEVIIANGLLATKLLANACVLQPETSVLQKFSRDFVVRCTNRSPGVGDAAAD